MLTIVNNYTASLNFVNFLYVLKSLQYAGIGLSINSSIGANIFNGLEYFTVLEGNVPDIEHPWEGYRFQGISDQVVNNQYVNCNLFG